MVKYYHVHITINRVEPRQRRAESTVDLSFDELEHRFLAPFRNANPVVINGRTVAIEDIHRIKTYTSKRMIGRISPIPWNTTFDVTDQYITGPAGSGLDLQPTDQENIMKEHPTNIRLQVFISHSNKDIDLARHLIELLQKALNLRSDQIRCTSVDGFRMQSGAPTAETLRGEVHDTKLLIGLITPNSMKSAYVIFELGARWGAEKSMIPLLALGTTPELLEGPIAGINALDSRDEGQVYQLLEETSRHLGIELDKTSSYAAAVSALAQASMETEAYDAQLPAKHGPPRLSEGARKLLVEATKDPSGMIVMIRAFGGVKISTNGKAFGDTGNARSEARWKQAIKELLNRGLIEDTKGKGEVFEVTHEGFEIAESLDTSR